MKLSGCVIFTEGLVCDFCCFVLVLAIIDNSGALTSFVSLCVLGNQDQSTSPIFAYILLMLFSFHPELSQT